MNKTLQEIHDMLLDQHNVLSKQLGRTVDPDTADKILTEMQEILHRIDIVQRLLFRQTSALLDSTLPKIQAANNDLTKAIQSIGKVADFLTSVSNFLKFVDEAIDIAKTLAVAAAKG